MPERKQHSACDECRRRKLKCPGELPFCSRCWDERIPCQYSMRKTMGRPRKRQRGERANGEAHCSDAVENYASTTASLPRYEDWVFSPGDIAREHDDDLNTQHQRASSISGAESGFPRCYSSSWGSGTGLFPTDYSGVDPASTPPSMSRDKMNDDAGRASGSPEEAALPQNVNDNQCTCLSTMYLAAANMESTRNLGFPVALTALKGALDTARAILICSRCVEEKVAGCQNIMLLHSLFSTIALGFEKLLKDIDAEATRAMAASETKTLFSGDNSPANMHMHTGTPDCPARFDIELEPEEWRKIAKRVVTRHIHGRDNQLQNLESLLDATEARQRAWHSRGFPRMSHDPSGPGGMPEEKEWTCLRMTSEVRRVISDMAPEYSSTVNSN